MTPFISVHVIVKEVTFYGLQLFNASLKSYLEDNKGYADEVILYDDGCDTDVKRLYYEILRDSGVKYSCYFDNRKRSFSEKRNICLSLTNKNATHIHWIDSDDIYYPKSLLPIKDLLSQVPEVGKFISSFQHCMGSPWHIENVYPKDNIFKVTPELKWQFGVHEKLAGTANGELSIPLVYYHSGYTRSIIASAIKWIYYSVLEGSLDHYLRSNQPMYNQGLNHIVDDRIAGCNLMPKDFPPKRQPMLEGIEDGDSLFERWQYKVNQCDYRYMSLIQRFQDKAQKAGNWGECIQHVIDNKLWETY